MPAWCDTLPGPASRRLVEAVLASWPEHEKFLERSFGDRDPGERVMTEELASLLLRLHPEDRAGLCRGYRWMCEMVLEEELHFRRTGKYRYSSFSEVNALVYQQSDRMGDYMLGLSLSSVLWPNHSRAIAYYATAFLSGNVPDYRHLEVGPGHGLLLYLAAADPRCASVTGLDISGESLAQTQRTLMRLGVEKPTTWLTADVARSLDVDGTFDSIVISEVCEHLEDPGAALRSLRGVISPGGRIFVNVPINSPAIDHIYLLESPEAAIDLVKGAGFEVADTLIAPGAGYSEQRARKARSSISVCVIGAASR